MFEITFLRHGESVGNRDGYHQGQHDFPLTPTGEAQAQALGQYWREHGASFDQLITSPLARARQTAEIVGQAFGLPLVVDPLWTERHNGILQGLSYAKGEVVHPRPDFITPYDPIGKTGESQWQLYLRVGKALQNLLRGEPGRYLVVSHGGLLNILMHILTGTTPQADFRGLRFPFENTAFTITKYDPQYHTWEINTHNTRPHLPPDLPFANLPYRFTFLRHGQSEGNLNRVFQGQADFPLSEIGHHEIDLLAKDWLARGVTFDKIIASPLTRARQTAEALAQALGLEIEFNAKWKEIDNGEMAG
ncbi:MAG: histidine phosphatase family protein, partial [Anaerolineales bacterium]|nr:histidine phosphatase family protein [Anaerolineales bacterium]